MTTAGRVVFSKMDEVIFGTPAAQAVTDLACRAKAERVFLMVSGTLNCEPRSSNGSGPPWETPVPRCSTACYPIRRARR